MKNNKILPDKILTVWMLVIGLHLFSYCLYSLGFWEKYPHLIGITHPFPFLHGPLLYLYVVFSLQKEPRFRLKHYAHFLPAFLAYLYMVPYFFFYTTEQKRMIDHGQTNDYRVFMLISLAGFIISGIAYAVLAYRLIGKYEKLVHDNFSFDEKISLHWLRYCISGIGLIFATVGIFSFLQYILSIQFSFNVDFIYFSEIILFVFFVGYFGIRHESIFSDDKKRTASIANTDDDTKKPAEYRKSGLKKGEAEQIHQQLLQLMDDKKPYLEPKLTLNLLSEELSTSPNYLSQIINQYREQNFYDFVNQYRIHEFKKRATLSENRRLNILAIAFDSGFNSKSSFNLAFKKHTGITPSQFIRENK
ncbi:helix-turn-helix domain-containing protein [Maribellus maritimus]|nr:helix-turn-helix domain-containing protein [Maribellus maritimus]